MTTDIKQSTEKNTPVISPAVEVQGVRFAKSSMKPYTTLVLLFIVVATLVFSIKYDQPFLKELGATGFILCCVFAMQINEQRAKRLVNDRSKYENLN